MEKIAELMVGRKISRLAVAEKKSGIKKPILELINFSVDMPGERVEDLSMKVYAITLSPDILFVSEPTRGIDIGAKRIVLDLLLKLNREMGVTVVMTSSELAELRSRVREHLARDGIFTIKVFFLMPGSINPRSKKRTENKIW